MDVSAGMRPNENKMSDGGREARVDRSGSMDVISKAERTAVRRSLHRLVRSYLSREGPTKSLLCLRRVSSR
jgi:hypothetical protein